MCFEVCQFQSAFAHPDCPLVNDAVRAAYREESAAREQLPPDTRGLVVIVADIGRGGLNQAVIAIEQARGRLNLALQALAPAEDDAS